MDELEDNELNDARETLEELGAAEGKSKKRRPYVGTNNEIVAGIIAVSIGLFWLLFSWLFVERIYHSNLFFLGTGLLVLILGIVKRHNVKNTDLDF